MLTVDDITPLESLALSRATRINRLNQLSNKIDCPSKPSAASAPPFYHPILVGLSVFFSGVCACGDFLIGSATLLSFLSLANITIFIVCMTSIALYLITSLIFQGIALARSFHLLGPAASSEADLCRQEHALLLSLAEQVGSEAFLQKHAETSQEAIQAFRKMINARLQSLKTTAVEMTKKRTSASFQLARAMMLAFYLIWQFFAGVLVAYYAILTTAFLLGLMVPVLGLLLGSIFIGVMMCFAFCIGPADDCSELVASWFSCDQKTIDLLSEGTLPTSANAALVFLERLLQKAPPVTAPHAPDSAYKSPLGASKNARPTTADDTLKNAA